MRSSQRGAIVAKTGHIQFPGSVECDLATQLAKISIEHAGHVIRELDVSCRAKCQNAGGQALDVKAEWMPRAKTNDPQREIMGDGARKVGGGPFLACVSNACRGVGASHAAGRDHRKSDEIIQRTFWGLKIGGIFPLSLWVEICTCRDAILCTVYTCGHGSASSDRPAEHSGRGRGRGRGSVFSPENRKISSSLVSSAWSGGASQWCKLATHQAQPVNAGGRM